MFIISTHPPPSLSPPSQSYSPLPPFADLVKPIREKNNYSLSRRQIDVCEVFEHDVCEVFLTPTPSLSGNLVFFVCVEIMETQPGDMDKVKRIEKRLEPDEMEGWR